MGITNNLGKLSNMITSTGSAVGIGTSSPNSLLSVGPDYGSGTGLATPTAIQMDNSYKTGTPAFDKLKFYLFKSSTESYGFNVADNSDLQYWAGTSSTGVHRWFTSQTERMRITSAGNVGIGTSSPSNTYQGLTIYGVNPSLSLQTSAGGGWTWTEYRNSSGVNNFSMGVNQSIPQFAIKAGAGLDSPNFVISSSGNVGVGGAPNERLSVYGPSGLQGFIRWSDSASGSAFLGWASGGVPFIHSNNNILAFGANGSNNFAETMRLTGGNVLIGTTNNLGAKLYVDGVIYANGAGGFASATYVVGARNPIWRFGNADAYGISYFQGTAGYGGNDTIGFHFGGSTTTSAGSAFQFIQNGNYIFAGSPVSDRRAKENINDLTFNATEKVMALQSRSYYMKEGNNKIKYGFIAQEVYEVLPDLISGDLEKDSIVGLDYNGLIPILVKSFQELEARLKTLENK